MNDADAWQLSPYRSFGPLVMKMPRVEVRATISMAPKEFRDDRGLMADYFVGPEVQAYYDESDLLCRVVVYEPHKAMFDGRQIMGMQKAKAAALLRADGGEVLDIADLMFHLGLGVGFMAKGGRVWSVEAFDHGYYDELIRLAAAP